MAEIRSISTDANRWTNIDTFIQKQNDETHRYCVALIGTDGKSIHGSKLSGDFDSMRDAFAALEKKLPQHPNAGVFNVRGV